MTQATAVQFEIGINPLYPGEKLLRGDGRWGEHTASFHRETHTIESLARRIAGDGCAFSAVMQDNYRKTANFLSAQHIGLDDDRGTQESSLESLAADPFIVGHAAFIYESPSSTPERPKSRIVFLLDEPYSDASEYRTAQEALWQLFEATDEHVKEPARFFYGRQNARCLVLGNILYRDVLQEQVIEPYLASLEASTNGRRVAEPLGETIGEGGRNATLTSLAGTMRRRGMSVEAISAALLEENSAKCEPPLPDDEVRGIANSVSRYEPSAQSNNGNRPQGSNSQVEGRKWPELTSDDPWPELGDLPQVPTAPALPEEMIPDPLRAWLVDVANHACLPLAMPTAPALVSLSALVGRRLGIRPNRYSDYLVVPNAWGAIVARPGALKSYAIAEGTRLLKRLAATARDRFQAEEFMSQANIAGLQAEIDGLKSKMKQLAKAKGSESMEPLKGMLADKLQELDTAEPTERRYWVADTTPEKLADLLRQNPQGLLVSYDELSGWLGELEKPGREGSRSFYLAAWEGTSSHYVDRIQRGTTYLPGVCLAVLGGIQPDRLRQHIDEAISGGGGGDGLLQRFQILIWIDDLGDWDPPNSWPSSAARDAAYEAFKALDKLDPLARGAHVDELGDIPYLRFSSEAQELYDTWRAELENRLRGDDYKQSPAFEAHLGKYRSLMPSLALLFHLLDIVTSGSSGSSLQGVSLGATELAADWCDFLEAHARVIYSTEVMPGVEAAHRLAEKIKTGRTTHGESIRDIYRPQWAGLTTSAKVNIGLEVLEQAGWVRAITTPTTGAPITQIELHPKLRGGADA